MIKYSHEYRVEPVPTELIRVGTQDAWSIERPRLEHLLNRLRPDGWVIQNESDVVPHGTLIFVRSKRVVDDEFVADTVERLTDWEIRLEEQDVPPGLAKLLEEMDPADIKVLVWAVLKVSS